MKQLVLRQRMAGRWHDMAVVENALETIVRGKPLTKAALWLDIAAKIEEAAEAAGTAAEFTIELREAQAHLFWRELVKLSPDAFGRNAAGQPTVVPLAPLTAMLREFSEELEEDMPTGEDGDDG